MKKFDSHLLVEDLNKLPIKFRTVFAVLCVERILPLLPNLSRVKSGDLSMWRDAVAELWADVQKKKFTEEELKARISTYTNRIPTEESGWTDGQAATEDCGAAIAYAYRSRLFGDSQEAAWSAQRAYELLDYLVTHSRESDQRNYGDEQAIISDPLIQEELGYQEESLRSLFNLVDNSDGVMQKMDSLRQKAIVAGERRRIRIVG